MSFLATRSRKPEKGKNQKSKGVFRGKSIQMTNDLIFKEGMGSGTALPGDVLESVFPYALM